MLVPIVTAPCSSRAATGADFAEVYVSGGAAARFAHHDGRVEEATSGINSGRAYASSSVRTSSTATNDLGRRPRRAVASLAGLRGDTAGRPDSAGRGSIDLRKQRRPDIHTHRAVRDTTSAGASSAARAEPGASPHQAGEGTPEGGAGRVDSQRGRLRGGPRCAPAWWPGHSLRRRDTQTATQVGALHGRGLLDNSRPRWASATEMALTNLRGKPARRHHAGGAGNGFGGVIFHGRSATCWRPRRGA